jgi:hypothetical protein
VKIAFLSPLPPAKTGVAHYASMVLPALRRRAEVQAFPSLDGYRAAMMMLSASEVRDSRNASAETRALVERGQELRP